MKCPRCEFVTSNDKDNCPRCGFDFHPIKESYNIQTNIIEKKRDAKSSFSDLVAIVDKMLTERKFMERFNPYSKTKNPVIDKKADEEISLPKITKPEATAQSSTHLEALMLATSDIRDINKKSSSNLEALAALTANINETEPAKPIEIIEIDPEEWKKCEIEIVRLSLANTDLGFVEILDLREDNEVSLLFELAEREIINPNSIQKIDPNLKKKRIKTNLDQAVKKFEDAHDQAEALKKLNILDSSTISLIGDFVLPATFRERFLSFIIDLIFTLAIALIFTWGSVLPVHIKSNIFSSEQKIVFELLPYIFDFTLIFFASWIITQCVLLATLGSTLGCKIFKIAITDQEGLLLSFRQSLLRSLSWSVTILSMGFGALLFFFNNRQTLHDRIAKTMVIKLAS